MDFFFYLFVKEMQTLENTKMHMHRKNHVFEQKIFEKKKRNVNRSVQMTALM